jgi:HEAT repeat protein
MGTIVDEPRDLKANRRFKAAIFSLIVILTFGFIACSAISCAEISISKSNRNKVDELMNQLKNDEPFQREWAATDLGELGDSQAVEPLIEALTDSDEGVRNAAVQSLGQIGDSRAVEPLITALKTCNGYLPTIAYALGKIGGPAPESLIEALRDGNCNVRWGTAEALGFIKDPAAVPSLIQALTDGCPVVRSSAAIALGEIDDISAVPALTELLKDNDGYVRWTAAEALGRIENRT